MKGDSAVDYVTPLEPAGTNEVIVPEELQDCQSVAKTSSKKKKKEEDWKEKYLQSLVNVDEKRCDSELMVTKLKPYNMLLRNIELEKSLSKFVYFQWDTPFMIEKYFDQLFPYISFTHFNSTMKY